MNNNNKLIYLSTNGEIVKRLVSDIELIRLVNESDFTNCDIIKVFDVEDWNNIFEIKYVGWQPGCLIEFVDSNGNVVVRGYGEDH